MQWDSFLNRDRQGAGALNQIKNQRRQLCKIHL